MDGVDELHAGDGDHGVRGGSERQPWLALNGHAGLEAELGKSRVDTDV